MTTFKSNTKSMGSTTTTKMKQSTTIISLPQARANIALPSQLAIAASILIQNQDKYVNTFELREQGVASVSQCIARLIDKGAVIKIKRKSAVDTTGNIHERIAHYLLKGWI